MDQPPAHSGVSTVSGSGQQSRKVADLTTTNRPRRRTNRGEPLSDEFLQGAKQVDSSVPQGVRPAEKDVIERPLFQGRNKKKSKNIIEVNSVDGKTYRFRIPKDEKARNSELPMLMLALALREVGIGGSPLTVFDAFGFRQPDLDGQMVYPLPEPIAPMLDTEAAPGPRGGIPGSSFDLGDDDGEDSDFPLEP